MYYWVQDTLRLRRVDMWEFSRLDFVHTCLSKRKLTQFIAKGLVLTLTLTLILSLALNLTLTVPVQTHAIYSKPQP